MARSIAAAWLSTAKVENSSTSIVIAKTIRYLDFFDANLYVYITKFSLLVGKKIYKNKVSGWKMQHFSNS